MNLASEVPAETTVRTWPRFAREVESVHVRLPEGRNIASVLAVAMGRDGDIFLLHQPNAQGLTPETDDPDRWLPPLVHLSAAGEFIAAWGGPHHIPPVDGVSQWPLKLEGLECDQAGDLWIFGYGHYDNAVLRFSANGELRLRIGQRGKRGDDAATNLLGSPTSCHHDIARREVFVSDGYGNHRVIAFNSDTGRFTRMWGAYGKVPVAGHMESFASPVHKVALGPNGLLYVADRSNGRIQEFDVGADHVHFRREVIVAPGTNVQNTGSTWDIAFAPEGGFMHVADGPNFRVWTIDLDTLEVLGSTTVHTEYENLKNEPLHFSLVHRFAVEPDGSLLLACVNAGLKRLRRIGTR